MIKEFTACESSTSKMISRALLSVTIGLGLIGLGVISEIVWWARIAIGLVGFLLGIQGYYDLKYVKGFKENKFTVN